ncbi:MAG: transglycosylase SLT domain-containing protein [bacterium]|nr:transglycosylase SLT domain-containing protein [bacterium]
MKNLLIFFTLIIFSSVYSQDKRIDYINGVLPLTTENLDFLAKIRTEYSLFWVLRDSQALSARINLSQYDSILSRVEKQNSFTPNRLKRICFVESYGKNFQKSWAGAVGIMQFMPRTAVGYGLKINQKMKVDDRLDPSKAIDASGKYLQNSDKIFGNSDIADATYHMGVGNMCKVLQVYIFDVHKKYLVITPKNAKIFVDKYQITMSKIYFSARPLGLLYNKLSSLKDNSMSYFWSLKAAEQLLAVDDMEYQYLFWKYRNYFDPSIKAPARYCTNEWCFEGVECEKDLNSLFVVVNYEIPKNREERENSQFVLRKLSEFQIISYRQVGICYKIVLSPKPVEQEVFWNFWQDFISKKDIV